MSTRRDTFQSVGQLYTLQSHATHNTSFKTCPRSLGFQSDPCGSKRNKPVFGYPVFAGGGKITGSTDVKLHGFIKPALSLAILTFIVHTSAT